MYIDDQSHEYSPSWANLLRKRYPNTGFPNKMSDEQIEKFGIKAAEFLPLEKLPDGEEYRQTAPELIDGVWTATWEIIKCP